MKKFYLIGKNINKSLSPHIHNYVFNYFSLDAKYEIKPISSSNEIPSVLLAVSKGDISGVNVTNPYKIASFNYINFFDEATQRIGSVNCINKEQENIKGYNTDWYGFKKVVEKKSINAAKVIGYGGAGRAVEYALLSLGIKNIQIYTRTTIDHPNNIVYRDISEIINQKYQKEDIIINSTPYHFINEMSEGNFNNLLSREIFWLDLLYTKLSTEREKYFNNNLYKNGIDMLIYQALASIDIWFRKNISKSVDLDDLKLHLKEVIHAN
tara:strand:- start:318 stop:1118 length:801 start_codon:yes stop_codon:yes gene_type:complete